MLLTETSVTSEQAVAVGLVQYPSLQINGGIRGGDEFDVSDATYDPSTGLTTLTIGTHSLIAGNRVTIKPGSIRFTCTSDGNQTVLAHPRKSDTPYNRSQLLTAVTSTTITFNAGASPAWAQYAHTFVDADPRAVVSNGTIDCVHDVTDILRALVFNLKYGGDNCINYCLEFYVNYSGNLQHITSQATETVWIIEKARDLAKRAMKDQLINNTAAYGVSRRLRLTKRPSSQLRLSDQTAEDLTSFNNLKTDHLLLVRITLKT